MRPCVGFSVGQVFQGLMFHLSLPYPSILLHHGVMQIVVRENVGAVIQY